MRKFISGLLIAFLFVSVAFADSAVLFDSTVSVDVLGTGYDWVKNARAVGVSGRYVPGKNLTNPVNYAIEFVTPFFNKDENGNPIEGAGLITNAAAIKNMEIVLTLNRGYDEVTVVWEQNGVEKHRKFKVSDSDTAVESMIEFTAKIDFSEYVSDPRNRSTAQIPVAGLRMTDIRLKRIMVTTHQAPGDWMYSPTSLVGVKKISVVYDKAVTPEAYSRGQEADEVFNIQSSKALEESTKKKLENYLRQDEYNKSLMASDESDAK